MKRASVTVPSQTSAAVPESGDVAGRGFTEPGLVLDGEELCGLTNDPHGDEVREQITVDEDDVDGDHVVDAVADRAGEPVAAPLPTVPPKAGLPHPTVPLVEAVSSVETVETVEDAPTTDAGAVGPMTVATMGKAWRALAEAVGDLLDGRDGIWALEAGAGTRPLFDLPEDAFIVGVDRDPRALETNVRLDQRVHTELADYRPLAAGFDLITSWYVVDDLVEPAAVLDRFADWTAQDGLVVLAVPNLRSPRGIAARLAGRSRLRRDVTPRALRRRFQQRGFTPVFQVFFEDADQTARRKRFRVTHGWWKVLQAMVRVATLGFLDAARTDYIVVFRRDHPPR
jgi:hypothetical protein